MTTKDVLDFFEGIVEMSGYEPEQIIKLCELVSKIADKVRDKANDEWHYPSKGEYPPERDWYLGIFEEPDAGFRLIPVVCDYLGRQTKATTKEGWIIRNCTDVNTDNPLEYYVNLKCVAWMPLPDPPKEEGGRRKHEI